MRNVTNKNSMFVKIMAGVLAGLMAISAIAVSIIYIVSI